MRKYNTRFREQMNSKKNSKKNKSKNINNLKNSKSIKKRPNIEENIENNNNHIGSDTPNNSKKKNNKLIIETEEEIYSSPYNKEKMDEEEKLNEIYECANYFNKNMLKSRIALNKEFLKKKLEFNFLREDKSQIFFNVPFFPRSEMFSNEQLYIKTNKNKFKLNNVISNENNQNNNTSNNTIINNDNKNNNKFQLQQNIKTNNEKSIKYNNNNISTISEEKQTNQTRDVSNSINKSLLDSSYVNNEIHIIDLSHKKSSSRPTTFALFGLYKDNNNNVKESNSSQVKQRNIFSSVFPNKNKNNNEESININNSRENNNYKNRGVIEIKEDDEDSSSSSNSSIQEKKRRKKDNITKEDHKIETFKILAERYKKNKEKLKKNIGERKFYLLEKILIKKNFIQ